MRFVGYALAAMGALLSIAAAGAYLVLRSSLPQVDGSRVLRGLEARVSVSRDALGVPSIQAQSRNDAARALGFVHGQERFFQMDVLRRLAAGELAALAGPDTLEMDRRNRPHRFRHFAVRSLDALPREDRMLLEAYADGVNSGLDAFPVRPWEYVLLRAVPEAWRPEDSLLMVYLMYLLLQSELVELELFAADIATRMPRELHAGSEPEEIAFEWSSSGRVARPGLVSRWVAYDLGAVNLKLRELDTARSVYEAVSIANRSGAPAQNFLVADSAGNIGWTLMGALPAGPTGLTESPVAWEETGQSPGTLAPEAYPQRINPESGLLWSANHRKGDIPVLQGGAYPPGARAFQIRERLLTLRDSTPEDHLAIQLDSQSPFLRRWQELLLRVLDEPRAREEARHQALHSVVAGWDGTASADSAAYLWVRLFRDDVYQHVLRRFLPGADELLEDLDMRQPGPERSLFEEPVWRIVHEQPPFLVYKDFDSWNDELLSRVSTIMSDRPDDPGAYDWGEENRAMIRHPIGESLPFVRRWLDMPDAPMHGDFEVPRASRRQFSASNRTVISLDGHFQGIFHMPSGQTGHPLSSYYGAGHDDWAHGRPTPFQPGEPRSVMELVPDA